MKENGVVPYSYQTMQCATQAKQYNVSNAEKKIKTISQKQLYKNKGEGLLTLHLYYGKYHPLVKCHC